MPLRDNEKVFDSVLVVSDRNVIDGQLQDAAEMSTRAGISGITYVAFTATPKAKTLELFGRRPNPALPASESNLPAPFHVYSMRQALSRVGFAIAWW